MSICLITPFISLFQYLYNQEIDQERAEITKLWMHCCFLYKFRCSTKIHLKYLAGVGFEPTQHSDYEPDELPITPQKTT